MKLFKILFFPICVLLLFICNYLFFNLTIYECFQVVLWYFIFNIFGIMALPVVNKIFKEDNIFVFGIAKSVGFLFVGYSTWKLFHLGIINFTPLSILAVVVLLFIVIYSSLGVKINRNLFVSIQRHSTKYLIFEIVSFSVFLIFLIILSNHPEIIFTEKHMDFTFLNYFTRLVTLPIQDPWSSGTPLKYYYFGYFFFSLVIKLIGLKVSIGYLLAVSTIAMLFASSIFSFFYYLIKRVKLSLFLTFIVLFSSNYRAFLLLLDKSQKFNYSFFWKSTRIFKNNLFAEFPCWSFSFMDLHPHVMSNIFTSLLLVLYVKFLKKDKKFNGSDTFIFILTLSLSLGVLTSINSWDYLLFCALLCFITLFSISKREEIVGTISYLVTSILFSYLLYLPMITLLSGREKVIAVVRDGFNGVSNYFVFHGHWFLLTLFSFFFLILLQRKKMSIRKVLSSSVNFFLIVPVVILVFLMLMKITTVPLMIFFTAYLFILLISLYWSLYNQESIDRVVVSLLLFLIVSTLLCEYFILMDRINTLFKGNTTLYMIFSVVALLVFAKLFKNYSRFKYLKLALFITIIAPVLLGSFGVIRSMLAFTPAGAVRPTLDGNLFLKKYNESDYLAISWLNDHAKGVDKMVEFYGKTYDYSTPRISMNTGLPIYVGWSQHIIQRGTSYIEAKKRMDEVDFIYESSDALAVYNLLSNAEIRYLVIGDIERRAYKNLKVSKFNDERYFKKVFSVGRTLIYQINW